MKTLIKVSLAALVLAGCSSSTHTVEVEGEPQAVELFVMAEQTRNTDTSVRYQVGETRAEFSVPTVEEQSAMRLRASAARLGATTRSATTWTIIPAAQEASTSAP